VTRGELVDPLNFQAFPRFPSSNDLDMNFMKKKKPAPRMFCDICDIFDGHETEDCPIQTSCMDFDPPPNPKPKKERKLPPPRKYCDNCEGNDQEVQRFKQMLQDIFPSDSV
jgi:hypothetical protein